MWINAAGTLYEGECAAGDRAATSGEIAAWQAARAAAAVPRRVTSVQGRAILRKYGLFDAVQAAIAAIGDDQLRATAQDAFDHGGFEIDSPLLNQVLTALGHDEAYRNALFVEAESISV